jgi:hypothetical protein
MAGIAATVLLAITAIGLAAFGLLLPLVASQIAWLEAPARTAVIAIGVLSVALALVAAFGAWSVADGRRSGAIIGLVTGTTIVLGAAIAHVSGGWHPALWLAVLMGSGIVGSLLLSIDIRQSA